MWNWSSKFSYATVFILQMLPDHLHIVTQIIFLPGSHPMRRKCVVNRVVVFQYECMQSETDMHSNGGVV
jgi:hypothetical protein